MTKLACVLSVAAVMVVAGCEPTPTEELLSIAFGDGATLLPVQVDTDCGNGGCAELAALDGSVTFTPDANSTVADVVEIMQYRVDYRLAAPDDLVAVPFCSDEISIVVPVGETTPFTVVIATDRQRDFIRNRLPGKSVTAFATLMLGGYDPRNEQVFPKADFEVYFTDIVGTSSP